MSFMTLPGDFCFVMTLPIVLMALPNVVLLLLFYDLARCFFYDLAPIFLLTLSMLIKRLGKVRMV